MCMKNDTKVDTDSCRTKLFNTAILSRDISARLLSSTDYLLSHCKTLNDGTATKLEKRKSTSTIVQSIVPLITFDADHLNESSGIISPIPGVSYVHRRLEKENKNEDPIDVINKLINSKRKLGPSHSPITKRQPPSSRSRSSPPSRSIPSRVSDIPKPSNGRYYSKAEVMAIMAPYNSPCRSIIRSNIITKLVNTGCVKGGKSTIYRDLKIA